MIKYNRVVYVIHRLAVMIYDHRRGTLPVKLGIIKKFCPVYVDDYKQAFFRQGRQSDALTAKNLSAYIAPYILYQLAGESLFGIHYYPAVSFHSVYNTPKPEGSTDAIKIREFVSGYKYVVAALYKLP